MQIKEESPKEYVDIARAPDNEMRPDRPVPFGLRPGRSAAALPFSTISTYGLRRAPCIHSVLATTHHAPIYEIGSSELCATARRTRTITAVHPAYVPVKNLLAVDGLQPLDGVDVALGVVEVEAGLGIHALHRSVDLLREQDVVRRNDLEQELDAR